MCGHRVYMCCGAIVSGRTAGPWSVVAHLDEHDRRGRNVLVSDDTPGARYRVHGPNACVAYGVCTLDDARAIASLPDLLSDNARLREALEDARVALTFYAAWMKDDERGCHEGHSHTYPFGQDAEKSARAALAVKGGA